MAPKKSTTKTDADENAAEETDAFRDPNATEAEDDAKTEDKAFKAPRQMSRDAPAVDQVAQEQRAGQTAEQGGGGSDATATQQIHSSALPYADRDPDKAWQDYAPMAIQGLYPHMRPGVDYAYGRKSLEADAEMLHWDERFAQPDMGKIEEAARKLVERDPNADAKSAPKQSIRMGSEEKDREILDPDVAQSEVNPRREGNEKLPSQPYIQQSEEEERERQDPSSPNKE